MVTLLRRLRTKWRLVNGLRLLWVAAILWFELGVFLWSLLDCRWPDKALSSNASTTHVLLIADPQLLDEHSYPGRAHWLLSLSTHVVDMNLRKSWNAVLTHLDPHAVVFLGDMMDNGRSNMDDPEYRRYYDRFQSIFRLNPSIPTYYVPGNHDVDLGSSSRFSAQARARYQAHFGIMNQRVVIGNYTLCFLDAPGLVDEDYRRHAAETNFQNWRGSKNGAVEFLKSFIDHRPDGPIVLFSHIPLSRSYSASCGPLRERGAIHPGVGHGYQNLLLRETSAFILEHVRPSIVFSGDDHDYCEYSHNLADGSTVREVTVKSFSMAMGVRKPGFQLLSLGTVTPSAHGSLSPESSTLADRPCLLPDQIRLYTHGYAPLFLITVLTLLIVNYNHRHYRQLRNKSHFFSVIAQNAPFGLTPRRQSPSRMSESQHGTTGGTRTAILDSNQSALPLPDDDYLESQYSFGKSPFLPDSHILDAESDDPCQSPVTGTRSIPNPTQDCATPRMLPGGVRALLRPGQACSNWWTGGSGQFSWYGRAVRDLCQVAWPSIWAYLIVSFWLFWR